MAASRPPRMVDVGPKARTRRVAVASGSVKASAALIRRIEKGRIDKGDPLEVSRIAAISATKRTSDLLPLCHPISLTGATVDARILRPDRVEFVARVEARDRTGVEMEALTAVAAACLCFYDLCKKHDRGMVIESIQLDEKSGGRSGRYIRRKGRKR